MIDLVLIGIGVLSILFGLVRLRDYRLRLDEFAPEDLSGMHPLWGKVLVLRRFNAHLDIWLFLGLGVLLIVFGIASLLGVIGE